MLKLYNRLITQNETYTEEEKTKVHGMEKYIESVQKYKEYVPEQAIEIFNSYSNSIYYLKGLPEEYQNQNIKRAIEEGDKIINLPTVKTMRDKFRENTQARTLRLNNQRQKRAGYTNASILLYIVFNLGLFIATMLLCFK